MRKSPICFAIILSLLLLFLVGSTRAEQKPEDAAPDVFHLTVVTPHAVKDTDAEPERLIGNDLDVYRAAFMAAHLWVVADFPPEYSLYGYRYSLEQGINPYDLMSYVISEHSAKIKDFSVEGALKRKGEVSDYGTDSLGKGGELGLAQITPFWVGKAKRKCKKEKWILGNCDDIFQGSEEFMAAKKAYKKAVEEFGQGSDEAKAKRKEMKKNTTGGMFEPELNLRVAAYVVRKAQQSHAEKCPSPQKIYTCLRKRKRALRHDKPPPACQYKEYHQWHAHLKLGEESRDFMCQRPGYKKRKMRQVRASIVSLFRPDEVWEEVRDEWKKYCSGY
jgi:hypothetical protein